MLPRYHLIVRSPDGEKRAVLGTASADRERGGMLSFAATMAVNGVGKLEPRFFADNVAIPHFERDGQVELWRNGRLLFRTLYQDPAEYEVDEKGNEYFIASCVGENHLLSRAVIAWRSDTINRTLFTNVPAESIMHTLVRYNITPEASVANGRLVAHPMTWIDVEPDLGRGSLITRSDLAGKNLLEELQEIALIGGVDFDLIRDGPRHWVFRVFEGQRGVDRTATVEFSRKKNTMGVLHTTKAHPDPRTVALVGGAGQEAARSFVVRFGPDYTAEQHREMFVNESDGGTVAMQAAGDAVLDERRFRSLLSFTPLQQSGARFGEDYHFGDLVRGTYREISALYQIVRVSLALDGSATESIQVELKQR